jgi:hypothetical protein
MRATRSRVRGPALLAVAAFALHQLRYLLAPAEGAEPHGYMPFAATLVVVLFAIAAGELALRVAGARDDGAAEAEPRAFWIVWLASSVGLIAIFAVQELTEAALAGGPLGDPLAGGGLLAVPLALVLGALVALALRWAGEAVLEAVRRRPRRRPRPGSAARPVWRPMCPVASVLGRNLAGRAPPQTS